MLFDILEACKNVTEFTAGLSFEQFTSNALVKAAVCMQFVVIGEALIRLRASDTVLYNSLPEADRTIAFRNVIAHGYDVIVDEIVWRLFKRRFLSCALQLRDCSTPDTGMHYAAFTPGARYPTGHHVVPDHGLRASRLGLRGLAEATVFQWLWGWLTHLRRRGSVMHPELTTLVRDGAIWALVNTAGRHDWMPGLGERTPRPVFLSLGQHPDFDRLTSQRGTTWWKRWLETVLGRDVLLPTSICEPLYRTAIEVAEAMGLCVRTASSRGDSIALVPDALELHTQNLHTQTCSLQATAGRRKLTVPTEVAPRLLGMPCLDTPQDRYTEVVEAPGWWATRFSQGDLRRVIAAEHTGLLGREERAALQQRFKAREPQPWYENLLSATPTLEMGVDIGDLSSVLLCAVPPNQASFV